MRTKLLATAAILAVGLASSMAQNNVYSLNVVGYVNQSLSPGFTMIANPLNTTNNTLQTLLAGVPAGTQILKWNGSGFNIHTKLGANWIPDAPLDPGDGAFINLAANYTNTWVGEVLQGDLAKSLPAGFSIASSQVPAAEDLTASGLAAAVPAGSQVLQWTGNSYSIATKLGASFIPNPTIGVGESFFVNLASPTDWVRNFTVTP
jgi:hypothetical protein